MVTRDSYLTALATLLILGSPVYSQVVLDVDQATGLVKIVNTSDSDTVNINGYDIRSPQNPGTPNDGLLNPAGWGKLATSVGNGWLATNFPSSELLLETNANNVLSLGPGASQSLGAAFTTNPATIGAAQSLAGFGNEYRDLAFRYTDADNGSSLTSGAVNYNNTIFNNLVLNVDLDSGIIQLKNESSVAIEIEAYIINSTAGSLNTSWNGLSDTVANWEKNIATSHALAEISSLDTSSNPGAPLAPLTINGGDTYDLGTAFNVGGDQDLSFSFLLTSDTAGNGFAGEVRYIGLAGDHNGDGAVNALDYVLWRLSPGAFGGDPDGYLEWAANYGNSNNGSGNGSSASGSAVPEPTSTVTLLSVVLAIAGIARRRQVHGSRGFNA